MKICFVQEIKFTDKQGSLTKFEKDYKLALVALSIENNRFSKNIAQKRMLSITTELWFNQESFKKKPI